MPLHILMANNDLSNLIKDIRDRLNLTQKQLAWKVGVTFSTVNNWGKGTRIPHTFLFQRLLGVAKEAGLKNIENIKRTKK
ncbi:hypothetical protein ES707_05639 [subsurface metagenome]